MNIVRKILQNSLWLFGAHAGGRLLNVVVIMALTRYLGIEDFGRYSLIYAFIGIFAFMTDIGVDMIIVREASRDPDKAGHMMGNGILLKTVFALLAIVSASVVANLVSTTFSSRAGMCGDSRRSVRQKRTPLFGGNGLIVIVIFLPV